MKDSIERVRPVLELLNADLNADLCPEDWVRLRVPERALLVDVENGRIVLRTSVGPDPVAIVRLLELLQPGRPFVFARCPVCKRIFARKGRAVRCSLKCTQRVHDENRAGTKIRREQNRRAAAAYRARKRAGRTA